MRRLALACSISAASGVVPTPLLADVTLLQNTTGAHVEAKVILGDSEPEKQAYGFTLVFPDCTSFSETNVDPFLTEIAPAPDGVALTIDHGTHAAAGHNAAEFVDSDGDPRAVYRVTIAP